MLIDRTEGARLFRSPVMLLEQWEPVMKTPNLKWQE